MPTYNTQPAMHTYCKNIIGCGNVIKCLIPAFWSWWENSYLLIWIFDEGGDAGVCLHFYSMEDDMQISAELEMQIFAYTILYWRCINRSFYRHIRWRCRCEVFLHAYPMEVQMQRTSWVYIQWKCRCRSFYTHICRCRALPISISDGVGNWGLPTGGDSDVWLSFYPDCGLQTRMRIITSDVIVNLNSITRLCVRAHYCECLHVDIMNKACTEILYISLCKPLEFYGEFFRNFYFFLI